MMKKTILAVALVMVGSAAVAGDSVATTSSCKSRMACVGRTVKHYGWDNPKAAVETSVDYAWNGHHSHSKVAVWGDRAVRLTGLFGVIYHGLVPASSKAYAYIAKQVKALRAARA